MRLISRSDVEAHLPIGECIALMRTTMAAASRGETNQLLRQFVAIPGAPGKMAMMPGTMDDPACFGIKLVCKYQRALGDPLGTHVGMVLLFDSAKGIPLAMVEGSALTAIRTAATSAMATDILARRDARSLAMIGSGEQAARHIDAMLAIRPIDTITIWSRTAERASAFAAATALRTAVRTTAMSTAAEAIKGADIICTTTSADEPVLSGDDLEAGQHLTLVGSAIPSTAEVDAHAVRRSRFYVDSRPAALAAAGELRRAIEAGMVDETHIIGEIGDVVDGRVAGRVSAHDITIYKSLGIAAQDLAAAHLLWSKASNQLFGGMFDLLD
ncbi:ornithine cyclodeaminase family protein [Sphingomonas sp. 28-63-12]|uniref:ornithine cyclodeaminase family protein n=1 Tax=Sphingomonas sp. 28-63-12 TaxID=1970434 RepID=UPI000BCE4928|nr:MAG: hypothetical protein B7Y47_02220 [Sphingomonas sp. 28-63-12]